MNLKDMKVIQVNTMTMGNKSIDIHIVEGNTEGGYEDGKWYVGQGFLMDNYFDEVMEDSNNKQKEVV